MPKVLIIDDDRDIAELVRAVLTDEGFSVSILGVVNADSIRVAVNQLEPDCILLDGESTVAFGTSWEDAAWMRSRGRTVPTLMFTANPQAQNEAVARESDRSQKAAFVGMVPKPFDLDELLEAVARATGFSAPFDEASEAEVGRTRVLVEKLEAAGAREIHTSTRREWANFRTEDGVLVQLYWWQRDGVYYVMRHRASGGRIEQVGSFYDLDAAIALAMTVRGEADEPSGQ